MVDQTSQFYAILTNVGAAKQANADALGIPWTFSQMGVGDGNPTGLENPPLPMPTSSQTALLNEWRRAPLNQLKVDPNNAAVIIAEQIIPADVGGKWIREIALYDADGDMVAVANCPPTFKPLLSQGSGRTQVVRVNLIVSSSSNVQLKIDPSVVLATREWVTEELAKQDFKHSVVAATTTAINLSGLQTVDGVALTAGARVLVKNQVAAKDNGLYLVVAGSAWTRCPDADSSAKVTPGMLVLVERGTVNGDSAWQLVTDAPITLGVTALAYEMAFGRSGVAGGTYRSVTVDAYGRVTAATNPTTVAGYGLTDVYTKTQIDQSLALKANLASPALTGIPTAPTPVAGTNTTQLATAAFVQSAIASLVASSPAALDTLNELAAALGNDPNFATTINNALALKAPLASPVFTGDPRAPTPAATDKDTSVATTAFTYAAMALFGIGGAVISTEPNMNSYMVPGNYVTPSAGLLNIPPGWNASQRHSMVVAGIGATGHLVQTMVSGLASSEPRMALRVFTSAQTWTGWIEFWHSGNTPKQVNPTDLTYGAILETGSFGLGKAIVSAESDLDKYTVPGNYLTPIVDLLNLPPGWNPAHRYSVVVEGYTSYNYLIQRITGGMATGHTPIFAVRVMQGAGSWTPWQFTSTSETLPFRGTQAFKTAGVSTWTVPVGVKKAWVTVIGGGGGGGCSVAANNIGSGGGGGGGLAQRLVDLSGVASVSVTVGAGGVGASVAGNAGGAGGTSSFGAYLSATGGAGGGGNSTVGNAPGAGGRGSGGDHNTSLGAGSPNYAIHGGSGGGPGPRSTQASVPGSDALDAGGGGSGAQVGQPGGSGAAGCVIIQW